MFDVEKDGCDHMHRLQTDRLREGKLQSSGLSREDTGPLPILWSQGWEQPPIPVSFPVILPFLVPLLEQGLQLLTFFRWEEFTLMTAVLATYPMWN